MPKSKRFLLSKSFYHVMTRGNNKNVVFRTNADYQYFLSLISKYKADHPFDLYHYCLMPTHTHFLIQTKDVHNFSTFMKKLNLAYFHHYNQEYGWVGHFWQGRFKSQPIGKDAYFIQCGKYIELNPIRKNLVDKPEDYQYSSYHYYAFGEPDPLITPDLFYEEMGKDSNRRQQLYKELIIDHIIEESYKKNTWGSDTQRYRESDKISRKTRKV